MRAETAAQLGLPVLAHLVGYQSHAAAPAEFTNAPIGAINALTASALACCLCSALPNAVTWSAVLRESHEGSFVAIKASMESGDAGCTVMLIRLRLVNRQHITQPPTTGGT